MSDALLDLRIGDEQRSPPRRRKLKLRLTPKWFLLLLAAAAAGFASWLAAPATAIPVEVMTVASAGSAGPGAPTVIAAGYVRCARVVHVVPRVPGIIATLRVAEGDEVAEGDIIATLESNDLEQEVAEARAGLRLALANLAQLESGSRPEELAEARAKVDAARVDAERAERDRDRSKMLVDGGGLSAQALDRVDSESQIARKAYEAARQSLALVAAGPRRELIEVARAGADAARARLARATTLLERTKIRAPLSGRVLRKFQDVGAAVSFGTPYNEGTSTVAVGLPIVSIGQLEGLEAAADISEADVSRISLKQGVEVRAEAYPGKLFHGVVARISPRADKNKNTIEVTVRLDDPAPRELAHDMSVKLSFLGDASEPAARGVAIPAKAVFARDNKPFVFVVEAGRARLRQVTVGEAQQDGMLPASAGLAEGDLLVVSAAEALKDGSKVVQVPDQPRSRGETR